MSRVKRGVPAHKKRTRLLKRAKGFFGARRKLYAVANWPKAGCNDFISAISCLFNYLDHEPKLFNLALNRCLASAELGRLKRPQVRKLNPVSRADNRLRVIPTPFVHQEVPAGFPESILRKELFSTDPIELGDC